MSAAAAEVVAKRAKLLRRTLVGLGLTAVVLLAVGGAVTLGSTLPVLLITLAVLAVCIVEVSRMGALRALRLWVPLCATGTLVGWRAFEDLRSADDSLREHPDAGLAMLALVALALVALPAMLAGHALVRSSSLAVRLAALVLLALLSYLTVAHGELDDRQLSLLVALVLFVLLRVTVIGAERRGEALATVLLGALLCIALPGLAWVWGGYGAGALVTLLAICKVGDSAAYYAGSTLGRHHPFPAISPGKTSEGCAASLLAGAAVGAGAVALGLLPRGPHGILGGLLAGAVVNVAGQVSDLLESWVKRKAGVKDSATYLGPSGGMLDLVDSFLLATPAALLLWPWILRAPPG